MTEVTQDKEFIEYIAKAIVSNPDDVVITRTVDEMGVLLTLKIHKDDMGYIIGRQGNTAKAIRTLLKVIGAKNNSRINFKIEEPEGSDRKFEKREERAEEKVDTDMVDDLKI